MAVKRNDEVIDGVEEFEDRERRVERMGKLGAETPQDLELELATAEVEAARGDTASAEDDEEVAEILRLAGIRRSRLGKWGN